MKDQKRGKNVALLAAVLQTIITLVMIIIWRMTGSGAALSSLWMLGGGVAIWLVTAVLFYARQLEQIEALEYHEIQSRGPGSGIVDKSDDLALRPAASRVVFLERWFVPIFTILLAAYNAAMGILMLRYLRTVAPGGITNAAEGTVILVLVGFGAFLFSRYCTGMGKGHQWRLLRPAGSMLLACALFIAAVAIALLVASQQNTRLEHIVAYILPSIEILYAIELLLNFVLDLYRPRIPGHEYRPSYESRLLNLLAEPGRVGHSLAEAANYQFGFEVSKTWFYQLISRAIVPLIIFGVFVMFALSSVVIVRDGEQYVVKHWGQIAQARTLLQPGLAIKWPWPIDTVEQFNTGAIQEVVLGVGEKTEPKYTRDGQELILWTQEHGFGSHIERDFLVGIPRREESTAQGTGGKAPAVSIIKLVVVVRYRIKDPYKYGYKYTNAKELLRCVANEEMVRYCASATLDQDISGQTDRPQAIMTHGRAQAARVLKKRIQTELDKIDLGVKIVFVGIVSAHPPAAAVPQFEKVLETERLQDQQRYKAQAQANRTLSQVAGNPGDALELFLSLSQAEVFGELSKIKNNQGDFAHAIDGFIRRAQGQVSALSLEIHREKLLGKKTSDMPFRTMLRGGYRKFLAKLLAAKKLGPAFDYAQAIDEANRQVDALFARLEGTPAKLIADAQAYRWKRQLREQTALETYLRMLLPFGKAPRVYMFDRYMDVLDETLPGMKKYVIGIDRKLLDLRMDLKQQRSVIGAGLEGATGE
jgi:regulator of protease activity HflC (stomatin/prohibitin superfamily)